MYLTANFFNINCATGMSCLMRKNIIDEAGGLKHFAQYLAEDFFLAEMFLKKLDLLFFLFIFQIQAITSPEKN